MKLLTVAAVRTADMTTQGLTDRLDKKVMGLLIKIKK